MEFIAPFSVAAAVLAGLFLVNSAFSCAKWPPYRLIAGKGRLQLTVALAAAMAYSAASADHFRKVDGVSVYLGIIPTALVLENVDMHEGYARKEGHYHITVALFDSRTGERLRDASVEVEVAAAGLESSRFRPLEPMTIAGTVTFGQYFQLPLKTVYRIFVRVRLADRDKPLAAVFEYDRREPDALVGGHSGR